MFTFDFSSSPIWVPQGTATYWLELYNNSVESGNFYWETGNLDGTHGVLGSAWYTTTPGTAWNLDGATDLSALINGDDTCVPCPVGAPTNPSPATGSVDVDIGADLSWTNGAGTTTVEVFFNEVSVYSGAPITTFDPGTLDYLTTYTWRVICKNDTCGTQGPTWTFTTEQNPNLATVKVYPQNANYWTGTCNQTAKTQVSLVNAIGSEVGWMVFDVSSIPPGTGIISLTFHGYLFANNWPYWSITPMGSVNPITGNASDIYNQVSTNYDQGLAYSYNQEPGTLPNDWTVRELTDNNAVADFEAALAQGWFAIGIVDWDFSTSYYVEFQGWAEANIPYLEFELDCLSCYPPNPPSNLTAQVIYNPGPQVQLNWQDNSWNEYGFKVYRKYGYPNDPGDYIIIDTTFSGVTQFIDASVMPESTYTYKVYAFNPYGQNGSNTATITVPIPVELISFTCEVDEDVVTLFWQTATETNNQGFEMERAPSKSPPKGETSDWERIGFVEGKGTTTEIQSYSFQEKPEPGKYKYRLKQIDYDGSYEYSQEIEAEVKPPLVFSLEQNYPNPFNPNTTIRYTIPSVIANEVKQSQLVTLKVYDILGNEIAALVNEEQPAGKYEVEFSTSSGIRNLTSGIYFYQLKAGEFMETKKMLLLK
jgi:hypothetical protein